MLFLPISDGILCRKQPSFDYAETQRVVATAITFVIIIVISLELIYAFSMIPCILLCFAGFHLSFISANILSVS